MATNSELLDQAMSRLGQRSSTRVRSDIVAEINTTIDRLERAPFLPWFLEQDATLSISTNDTSEALPSDFLREATETRPWYTEDGDTYYLEKRFYAALQQETPTSLKYYAIKGETFYFKKTADKAYTVTLPYYAAQTGDFADNSSDVSNLWLLRAHDWVVNEALSKVAAFHVQNEKLAIALRADASSAKWDIINYHESRENEGQDFFVGGASDGS